MENEKWEIIEEYIGKTKHNEAISLCKCKKCGNIKQLLRTKAKRDIGICEKCIEIYIQSFVGKQIGSYVVIRYSHTDKQQREYVYEMRCTECEYTRYSTLNTIKSALKSGKDIKSKCPGCKEKYIQSFIGVEFNTLRVMSYSHKSKTEYYYICKCIDCGKEYTLSTTSISSKFFNCTCVNIVRKKNIVTNKKHGMCDTRIYNIYKNMKARCYRPTGSGYENYGARGIRMCDEWLGENGFINFYNWAIENGYTDELTIERIDVNGNYCPENCKWIPPEEQYYNKTTNVYLNIYGIDYTLSQVARMFNVDYNVLWRSYYRGDVYELIHSLMCYHPQPGEPLKKIMSIEK